MGEHDENILRQARDLYAIYCASSDGKNYQGLPCPAWDALTPAVRGHWCTVARRALQLHGSPVIVINTGEQRFVEPDGTAIGHLPDREHALEIWRGYSGLS